MEIYFSECIILYTVNKIKFIRQIIFALIDQEYIKYILKKYANKNI